MTREEERELIAKAQAGDVAARNKLVEQFLPLLYKLAGKQRGFGTDEQEDMVQQLAMDFMTRLKGFDLSKNVRLSTYIVQGMTWASWYRSQGPMRDRWHRKHVRQFSQYEKLGKKGETESLTEPASGIETPLQIVEAEQGSAVREVHALRMAIAALPDRERYVMERRLQEHALEKIGADLGISRERVRQIEDKAVAKITVHVLAAERQPETESRRAARLAAARRRRKQCD